MRKHEIPRKKQSETRLFVIFSLRSLASTFIGAMFGALIGILVMSFGFKTVGWILIGFFAFIGFLVGTVPMFYIPIFPSTKSMEGMYLNEIVMKYIKFKSRRALKVLKRGE